MSLMGGLLSGVALMIAALTLIAVTWSIARPDRRVWPPQTFGPTVSVVSWSATFAFFSSVIALGLLGWGVMQVPNWLRYGAGPILILAGNAGVWFEVIGFGARQTMGAKGRDVLPSESAFLNSLFDLVKAIVVITQYAAGACKVRVILGRLRPRQRHQPIKIVADHAVFTRLNRGCL